MAFTRYSCTKHDAYPDTDVLTKRTAHHTVYMLILLPFFPSGYAYEEESRQEGRPQEGSQEDGQEGRPQEGGKEGGS